MPRTVGLVEGGNRLTLFISRIATAIASSLDLTDLDNLSRTCRAAHQALLQYRGALVARALRCVNEDLPVNPDDTFRYRARASNWHYMEELGRANHRGTLGHSGGYNGKSGSCARDMVAECRRCSRVVCRVSLRPSSRLVSPLSLTGEYY